MRYNHLLWRANHLDESFQLGDDVLNFFMAAAKPFQHHVLGHFVAFVFDHVDVVARAGHEQVHLRLIRFFLRRVDDELAVKEADAHRRHQLGERDARDAQRSGRADDAHDVGRRYLLAGQRRDDDLRVVAEVLGKDGAQRPVDAASVKDGVFAGAAFALEEASGKAPGGVHAFFKVHHQWEEVGAFAGLRGDRRRDEKRHTAAVDEY
jgi:hypothetical protein